MKKFIVTAALLAATAFALPGFVGQSEAAAAQNPYCKMANTQKNPVSWSEYYGCFGHAAATKVSARRPVRVARSKDPYCKFASAQRNVVSWNTYYHCLNR